jgi:two-component system, OmpR family, alkaline phosphatase synthesis response regulator PhoP
MNTTPIKIISKLRSSENKRVLEAVGELRAHGWLSDGTLKNIALIHAHLEGADLMNADLEGVDFHQAHMEFTDLSSANLSGAELVRATLKNANLSNADITGADLFKANLVDAIGLTLAQLRTAKRLIGATLPDGKLYDGRYNLEGDKEFLAWSRINPNNPADMAKMLGIPEEVYIKGQELYRKTKEEEMATILIIDDDPDIVLAARTVLESAGYRVNEASNTSRGFESMQANRPDLIILDVMMDTQTEGFEFARKLNDAVSGDPLAEFKDIPILMLTSVVSTTPTSMEPDIDDLPVEMFVDKPIDMQDLLGKVAWALESRIDRALT